MFKKIVCTVMAISIVLGVFGLLGQPEASAYGDVYATVSAGDSHSAAIRTDGSLWVWGRTYHAEAGWTIERVKIMENVAAVSAGAGHTMFIKNDSTLWGFGWNSKGQVGDGNVVFGGGGHPGTPVKIMDNVKAVSAHGNSTFAIKTDGSLWSWGENSYGELGDTGRGVTSPRPAKLMDDVVSVSGTMAIKTDGSLWGWGFNRYGRLANDKVGDEIYPPMKIMEDVAAVSTGNGFSVALKKDGTLWGWGVNSQGQLGSSHGMGSLTDVHTTPIKIMDNVASVSAGLWHVMAIKKDGTLWSWGSNFSGELGDGTTKDRHTPVKILDNVAFVSAGSYHTLAVKKDGTLWGWGQNFFHGQLGIGTLDGDRLTPVRITDRIMIPSPPPPPPIKVILNGEQLSFDEPPQMINGRTMVPLRAVFTAMGASVSWNSSTQTVTAKKGDTVVVMTVGNTSPTINGKVKTIDQPSVVINGRILAPLRFVAEAFGGTVTWDNATRTATITS